MVFCTHLFRDSRNLFRNISRNYFSIKFIWISILKQQRESQLFHATEFFCAFDNARERFQPPDRLSSFNNKSGEFFPSTLHGRLTLHAGHYNWHECKWYHYGQLGSDIWVFFSTLNERNWRLFPTFHSRLENTFGEIIADGNFNKWFMSEAVGGIMFRFASNSAKTASVRDAIFLNYFNFLENVAGKVILMT